MAQQQIWANLLGPQLPSPLQKKQSWNGVFVSNTPGLLFKIYQNLQLQIVCYEQE